MCLRFNLSESRMTRNNKTALLTKRRSNNTFPRLRVSAIFFLPAAKTDIPDPPYMDETATMKSILYIFLAASTLFACKKDEKPAPVETPKAKVDLISPKLHQHCHPGDTIWLEAVATAPEMMHGYEVYIFNKDNGDTLFHEHGHAHGQELQIKEFTVNPGLEELYSQAYVKVYIDHEHNFVADSVDFHCLIQ